MSQLGRISGVILKDNLLRDGVNLAFENDLLYLEVTNKHVGVNTDSPVYDLDVVGTTKIQPLLLVNERATIGNVIIDGEGYFSTVVGPLNLVPSSPDAIINHDKVLTENLEINDNFIRSTTTNTDIIIDANPSGKIKFNSNVDIDGDLYVTGNINIDGDLSKQGSIIIGDNILEDTVTILPNFQQNLKPGRNNEFDLGTPTQKWRQVWAKNTDNIDSLTAGAKATIGGTILINGITPEITSLNTDPITLSSDTNVVIIENLKFENNTITNLSDLPLALTSTGIGYVKFSGTNGFVMPFGNTAERPTSPELGDTRWNTEIGQMESFDGTEYVVSTGAGKVVTAEFMEEISYIWNIILG